MVNYTRDSLGRITERLEKIDGRLEKLNYTYDIAVRLKEVKRNDTSQAIYSYDGNGNRLARITPTAIDSGKYDAQDRLISYSSAHVTVPCGRVSIESAVAMDISLILYLKQPISCRNQFLASFV